MTSLSAISLVALAVIIIISAFYLTFRKKKETSGHH
ncbi:LPXTG cell wall anchor domain-containing protein [Pedobacter africanus]|nr:LPXTG cell wall anchor domain-containing protein [Pedobacter africanus]